MLPLNLFCIRSMFMLLILCFDNDLIHAQERQMPKILERLIQHPSNIPIILGGSDQIVNTGGILGNSGRPIQTLIRSNDHLYCNVDGTGWLYELTDSNGILKAKRIDSTFYQGNSFGALHFVDNKSIYSFGGYGFWRTNGLLRKFNQYTHEWDIVKIEEEVPYSNGYLNWLDTVHKRLYFSLLKFHQDGFKKEESIFKQYENKLFILDLRTGKWEESARLTGYFNGVQVPGKWGTLSIYGPDSVVVLDYLNNELHLLRKDLIPQFNKIFSPKRTELYYCIDSTLYFGSITDDVFDSIRLSTNDLIPTGRKLYTELEEPVADTQLPLGWMAATLFMGALFAFIYIKRPFLFPNFKNDPAGQDTGSLGSTTTSTPHIFFTPIELSLMQLLLDHSSNSEDTSQEELNKLLGLSSKKLSIQKKNRNDVINSINQKWGLLQNSREPLIERKRSPNDMRVYSYVLKKQSTGILSEWLHNASSENH